MVTLFLDTLVGHSYLTRFLDALVVTLFLDSSVDLSYYLTRFLDTLFLDILVGHSCLTLLWNTLTCHFLYDTLT